MQQFFSSRRLLAQAIMPRISAEDYFHSENSESLRNALHTLVREEGIGGVCVFAGDALETAQMLKELQTVAFRAGHLPLLVSADFEYGVAMRLSGGTAFPHAMALGMADRPEMTEKVASAIAKEAKVLGVHWNFAPVCDVNSNPNNPVINIRSFGETPDAVSRHATAFIRGTQAEAVLATAKHFPGHGDTAQDSHFTLPTLAFERSRLDSVEFTPFRTAITEGVHSVMVGHLAVPSLMLGEEVGTPNLPASLSTSVMTRLLRDDLRFQGIIVTDGLDMKAITNHFSVEESAEKAFAAGADIILLPPDPLRALNALEAALKAGAIPLEKVYASAQRILEAKIWCGLLKIDADKDWRVENLLASQIQPLRSSATASTLEISKQEQSLLALDAAKPALRWFGDEAKLKPLGKFRQIAGFALVEERDITAATNFFRYLAQTFSGDCDFAFVDADIADDDLQELIVATQDAEAIVFAVFVKGTVRQVAEGSSDQDSRQFLPRLSQSFENAAKKLAASKPSVAALFGTPYLRETFPADAFLCVYSSAEPALGAAAAELTQHSFE